MTRQSFDLAALVHRTRHGPCFICGLVAGDSAFAHHVVAEDDDTIAFLSKYPTLPGYCLVAPKAHVEDLSEGISAPAYLHLQTVVHHLSRALKRAFDAERIYVLSLGSQQGNSHLHWHVVPLPKGVPYEQQQYHALMAEHGVLHFSDIEMAGMATRIQECWHALPGA